MPHSDVPPVQSTGLTNPTKESLPQTPLLQIPLNQNISNIKSSLTSEDLTWKKPQDAIIVAPYKYMKSLPSKGVRDILIDGLNIWFQVEEKSLVTIKSVVDLLHTSSLMFDDVEDNSTLRRGKPAAHSIFGVGQTINSATYFLLSSLTEAASLSSKNYSVVIECISNMLLGQSLELYTTYLGECPTEEEYLHMIDNKTGRLFQVAYQLLQGESKIPGPPHLDKLMLLFGRHFQVRDDYVNLTSEEYKSQKGFCEDLDEGKFTLPIIYCMTTPTSLHTAGFDPKHELQNIFQSRARLSGQTLSLAMKIRILQILEGGGGFEYSKARLGELERELCGELARVEEVTGLTNPFLRGLVEKLKL